MFGIKGLAARIYFAFTLASPSARPCCCIRQSAPCPDGADHQGQEWGRGAACGRCGTGWARRAHEPRMCRHRPGNRLQTVAFCTMQFRSAREGGAGNLGVKQGLTVQDRQRTTLSIQRKVPRLGHRT
jgi:hypothetical protein